MQGLRWKEWSLAELLWVVHSTTTAHLKEESPHKVRLYLTQTKDYTVLREWDNSQMKDKSDK